MLSPSTPALILAPMQGLTDAPMRAVQGEIGAFTFAVSEFLRISVSVPGRRAFHQHIPEILHHNRTPTGLPVQVQLLGGDPGRMAQAAFVACRAGATAIDINFGCPAPTVNRHDGGATLLKYPDRLREIVAAVRDAVPPHLPVSAKLRLGWDTEDAIFVNAERAAEGGASWITIHGRTRDQGYKPPALWYPIGIVREQLGIPVVANGDIWTLEDFRRCREETGCQHFMLGRSAMANPLLSHHLAHELGIPTPTVRDTLPATVTDWRPYLKRLLEYSRDYQKETASKSLGRLKQWLNLAHLHGGFTGFDQIKRARTVEEVFATLSCPEFLTASPLSPDTAQTSPPVV